MNVAPADSATCFRRSRSLPAAFRTHVLNVRGADTAAALTPVRLLGSVSFLYFKHNDVYILFVTKQNANAMLAMSFMKQVGPGVAANRSLLEGRQLSDVLGCPGSRLVTQHAS